MKSGKGGVELYCRHSKISADSTASCGVGMPPRVILPWGKVSVQPCGTCECELVSGRWSDFRWDSSLWLKAFPGERFRSELSDTDIPVAGGESGWLTITATSGSYRR